MLHPLLRDANAGGYALRMTATACRDRPLRVEMSLSNWPTQFCTIALPAPRGNVNPAPSTSVSLRTTSSGGISDGILVTLRSLA